MQISRNFWSPILRECVLNEEAVHQSGIGKNTTQKKFFLISSDENTFVRPNSNNAKWKKISSLFPCSSSWILNSQSKKYHISVCLSDFYDCCLSKEKYEIMKKFLPSIPQKVGEELIKQNFINMPNHIIANWPGWTDWRSPNHDGFEKIDDKIRGQHIPSPEIDIRNLYVSTFLYKKPPEIVKPEDIRIYLNFFEKTKFFEDRGVYDLIRIINHIMFVSNSRKILSRFIFSGSFSNLNCSNYIKGDVERKYSKHGASSLYPFFEYGKPNPDPELIFVYVNIREVVFEEFLSKISIISHKLDQQYEITKFPREISNLVIEYTQYLDIKNFYNVSTSEVLELFVSKCNSQLELLEHKASQNQELEIAPQLNDLPYLNDPDLSIC